jgi:hypothetical protein
VRTAIRKAEKAILSLLISASIADAASIVTEWLDDALPKPGLRMRRLARLHARIATIHRDATHKATAMLTRIYRRISIEDLNVGSVARNRHLARFIMDSGFPDVNEGPKSFRKWPRVAVTA